MFATKELKMRINEVLTESAIQELNEGPIGQAIGKAAGGLAKGAGAVAGGIAGMGSAAKQGYQAGKAAVSGEPVRTVPNLGQPGAIAATAAAEPTAYKQARELVAKLDKKGKQRLLAVLAKDLKIQLPGVKQPAPAAVKPGSSIAPAGSPAAKPKLVRGGRAKAA